MKFESNNGELVLCLNKTSENVKGAFIFSNQNITYRSIEFITTDEWAAMRKLCYEANSYFTEKLLNKYSLTSECWDKFFEYKQSKFEFGV